MRLKTNRISIGFKHQVDTKLDLDLHRQLITPDRFNVLRDTEGARALSMKVEFVGDVGIKE